MLKQTICELSEIDWSTIEGFHVPEVSGSQVQLTIFLPSFRPITNYFIKTRQEESVFGSGEILIRQTFQDFNCSFALYTGLLHVENSSKNPQIFRINAGFALLARRDGLPIWLEKS